MIVVFGSLGADLVTNVKSIPKPGETVICPGYFMVPGGKGANSAVAAARAGSAVRMVGSCGNDGTAPIAMGIMKDAGVDVSTVQTVDAPTCIALIIVDEKGENSIVVASGANRQTKASQLDAVAFGAGDIVMLQNELLPDVTFAGIAAAKKRGARVVLNMAPAGPIPAETLKLLDVLVVNEHEAVIVANSVGITTEDPEEAVREINARFGVTAIVTLGAAGAVGWTDGLRRTARALAITPVDTTAAGDTFTGAFCAALDQGHGFTTALARGAVAGSLACLKPGAQPSIPSKGDIDTAMEGHAV